MHRLLTLALLLLIGSTSFGQTPYMEEIEQNYSLLDLELLNNPGESAAIQNFVYEKDVATITLKSGTIYLLRYVLDRPTTALFIGEGNVTIHVPSDVERNSLERATGDTVVNEDFEICFIRMADDFDLALKEQFDFESATLSYREFSKHKQAQGEYFFHPQVFHKYDNYFQLLRSCYERNGDGYFWMDFNRYVFSYDPNRPEQVLVGYEYEGGDIDLMKAVVMQSKERGIYNNWEMSDIIYPTTIVRQDADLVMGGLDGKRLESADATMSIQINADSLRFLCLFLYYNLKDDGLFYKGEPVGYIRRRDFPIIGVVLPEYVHRGDTIQLSLKYHGKEFDPALPFVTDPTPYEHRLHFAVPGGYSYLMPGKGPVGDSAGIDTFTVVPVRKYYRFEFQPYVSGFDTVSFTTDDGLPVHFLHSGAHRKQTECFVPDEVYHPATMGSLNDMLSWLGRPPNVFQLFVFPESTLAMPGLLEVPRIFCYRSELGGIVLEAASQTARQWFGPLLKPASYRESWLSEGVVDYIGLMHTQQAKGSDAMYLELNDRKGSMRIWADQYGDAPLAIGTRQDIRLRSYKSSWVFHMLRLLMTDPETMSDGRFRRFLYELQLTCNMQEFTNRDVADLAAKHYGDSLDWFFDHWLFDRRMPHYKVTYQTEQRGDGWYITGNVLVENVPDDFKMPVFMRVELAGGEQAIVREMIPAPSYDLELGPFASQPTDFDFNEFDSVLGTFELKKR